MYNIIPYAICASKRTLSAQRTREGPSADSPRTAPKNLVIFSLIAPATSPTPTSFDNPLPSDPKFSSGMAFAVRPAQRSPSYILSALRDPSATVVRLRNYNGVINTRSVHVKATPSTTSLTPPIDVSAETRSIPKLSGKGPFPQTVQFEVLGAPHSLLSVSLPSSSILYTRRGSLMGATANGDINNAVSTLSMLKPIRRAVLGIPFLYQNISSTTPLTCLISTNSPNTTFAVIELDGAVDWMVTQRNALLAWTGHSIRTTPVINRTMSPAHWGNSRVSGRGLAALVGKGQVYQVILEVDEEMVIHPNHLVAYSMGSERPRPYRLAQTTLRFQLPRIGVLRNLFPRSDFIYNLTKSDTYKTIAKILYETKTWIRRVIWGDRLFLRFKGPVTILVQSRTSRMSDILTKEEINDIATVEPGALKNFHPEDPKPIAEGENLEVKKATVQSGGKVTFEDSNAKEFIR